LQAKNKNPEKWLENNLDAIANPNTDIQKLIP